MSRQLIEDYYRNVQKVKRYSGSKKEMSLKSEFANLLNSYCKTKDLILVPELEYKTSKGTRVNPDGTVKDALRLDWGYWESKDEYDDLDKEIAAKIAKGYPTTNIIFEDSQTAVLVQQGTEVNRVPMTDAVRLDGLIKAFINYEREEIKDFHKAIAQFNEDLPVLLDTLRQLIETQGHSNDAFRTARDTLLSICQQTINPHITVLDIREMLIQHILTEEIFISIFNDSQFHRENTIAKELEKVSLTFFTGRTRKDILGLIDHYYLAIKAAASNIPDHHEKQKFLKLLYERFYRTYNPKAADRLGIFYTPNEIVQFMVRSANCLSYTHFGKLLSDKNVEILDPATGTGTFITELIENLPEPQLTYKYKNEIHCNEVAILPYYIANLNIEFIYKQKTGRYEPFSNICFVDTLDNTGFQFRHKQTTLFDIGDDNLKRIKRQNERKISVIIGNPPYNANQLNENENNKNREYPFIDARIRETYVKDSKATKTKVYDMYARFYRWASDRVGRDGIVAFITNRSFIDSITFDGFRKHIEEEFNYAYIIDTKSDVRDNPKISGTTHNVFGIQTGVAVMFLVRQESNPAPCLIKYFSLQDEQRRERKLEWFAATKIEDVPFEHIQPDKMGNWITTTANDFEDLLPLVSVRPSVPSIFGFYSIGVSTNRDEWVYDYDKSNLTNKIRYFVESYNAQARRLRNRVTASNFGELVRYDIKWSDSLKDKFLRNTKLIFDKKYFVRMHYRPYVQKHYYCDKVLSDRLTAKHFKMFGDDLRGTNRVITFSGIGSSKTFSALASETIWSVDFIEKTQGIPLFVYTDKKPVGNVTEWGLRTFRENYKDNTITAEAIFYYVYAIFHSQEYRDRYEVNLRRELPRIPLLNGFWQWAKWGEELINLHTNYVGGDSFRLKRTERNARDALHNIPKLKADKELGKIFLDEETILEGVPREAWSYKIGSRSAIEWVLDQYKEKASKERTAMDKFHTYRFKDYKEQAIDLIQKVTLVSVKTSEILRAMGQVQRTEQ
jgi:predicted helicase